MTVTINIPTADEAQRIAVNKSAKRHASQVVDTGQKLAMVLLELHADVTPADYATLGAAVKAITGITDVSLLIDGTTPATIPEGTELRVVVDTMLRIEPLPEEEPE